VRARPHTAPQLLDPWVRASPLVEDRWAPQTRSHPDTPDTQAPQTPRHPRHPDTPDTQTPQTPRHPDTPDTQHPSLIARPKRSRASSCRRRRRRCKARPVAAPYRHARHQLVNPLRRGGTGAERRRAEAEHARASRRKGVRRGSRAKGKAWQREGVREGGRATASLSLNAIRERATFSGNRP
jgi:hypothetical protein